MYDQNPEAIRLTRPFALSAADVLDVVAEAAGRSACRLRDQAEARNGGRLAAERPRDRLGPSDALLSRQHAPDTWRIK